MCRRKNRSENERVHLAKDHPLPEEARQHAGGAPDRALRASGLGGAGQRHRLLEQAAERLRLQEAPPRTALFKTQLVGNRLAFGAEPAPPPLGREALAELEVALGGVEDP